MNQLIRMLEAREKRQEQMLAQTRLELSQAREVATRQTEAALGRLEESANNKKK